MIHRIFVGLQLPQSFHEQLAAWRMQHADWPVRWTRATDLHLTILAPWDVESTHAAINAFQSLNGFFKQQTLQFDTIKFIHPEEPRMLWVEGSSNPELTDMKQRLHSLLERPTEEQAFRPHVTLARCYPEDVASPHNPTETVSWKVNFDSLVLYESRRDNFGARYTVLASVSA